MIKIQKQLKVLQKYIKIFQAIFMNQSTARNQFFYNSNNNIKSKTSLSIQSQHGSRYKKFKPNSFKHFNIDPTYATDNQSKSIQKDNYFTVCSINRTQQLNHSTNRATNNILQTNKVIEDLNKSNSSASIQCKCNSMSHNLSQRQLHSNLSKTRKLSFVHKQPNKNIELTDKYTLKPLLQALNLTQNDTKLLQELIQKMKKIFIEFIQSQIMAFKKQLQSVYSILRDNTANFELLEGLKTKEIGLNNEFQKYKQNLSNISKTIQQSIDKFSQKTTKLIKQIKQTTIISYIYQQQKSVRPILNQTNPQKQTSNRKIQNSLYQKLPPQKQQDHLPSYANNKPKSIKQSQRKLNHRRDNSVCSELQRQSSPVSTVSMRTHQHFSRKRGPKIYGKNQLNKKMQGFENALMKIRNMIDVYQKPK